MILNNKAEFHFFCMQGFGVEKSFSFNPFFSIIGVKQAFEVIKRKKYEIIL